MKTNIPVIRSLVLTLLISAGFVAATLAQEVSIPDPGLNAVIREALQKPNGPLMQQDMLGLTSLAALSRNITNLQGLEAARNLVTLLLDNNHITGVSFSDVLTNMTSLSVLDLSENPITNLTLPSGLTNLTRFRADNSRLLQLTLPAAGMTRLTNLSLGFNQLPSLTLPAGLTSLDFLNLTDNQLTNITLPPDMQQLTGLFMAGNPLTTLVLSEPLAATGMASVVDSLKNQGVSVFTYPLTAQLVRPLMLIGAFKFGITGPPGVYSIHGSTNLTAWSAVGVATNLLGSVNFHDATANVSPLKFYRVLLQVPPANMVFIPPNTFTMGSPTNELHRNVNEGPQTTVTLSRGFWIGKYEVTQGEYLSVMNTNPSVFPGDPTRPVSSVSWQDATNYCWTLTQREIAAGRIPPGSDYRLPTEAEWECAARAGTTTRFSYGDDPDYTSLTNHAWYFINGGFMVHPVGQKLPNPWGMYDMEGNVWEWCQDWLGPLPGGAVTDPLGPSSNPIGWKIVRGGGYDFGESDCRSARRYFFGEHPALNDSNLGFRVVLVTEQ